jgi:hypothetical protein
MGVQRSKAKSFAPRALDQMPVQDPKLGSAWRQRELSEEEHDSCWDKCATMVAERATVVGSQHLHNRRRTIRSAKRLPRLIGIMYTVSGWREDVIAPMQLPRCSCQGFDSKIPCIGGREG